MLVRDLQTFLHKVYGFIFGTFIGKLVGGKLKSYSIPNFWPNTKGNVNAVFEKFNLETIFGDVLVNISKLRFFPENLTLSLFSPYSVLTSCKESEKSLEPF